MTFPLILLPKRIVYVDDKRSFLDALRVATPRHFSRQFISSPHSCIDTISSEKEHWRHLERLLSPADQDNGEDPRNLLGRIIREHFGHWSRFHLTSVAVIDYSMPLMDGLEMIKALGGWPGQKVLLTGEADANVAISAFNSGLIHKFIPKDTRDLYRVIRQAHEEMHLTVCEHFGHLLRPALSQKQKDLLEDPRVRKGLQSKIDELEWSEYVVIGKPFGLVGISSHGPLQWMQLETPESLAGLAELAEADGCSPTDSRLIRDGALVSNNEFHAMLGLTSKIEIVDAFEVSAGPDLVAGVFDLQIAAWTSELFGLDDIMVPLEEVRAILRDIDASCKSLESPDTLLNSSSLEPVLGKLRALISKSKIHHQALQIAIKENPFPSDVRALILANGELGRMFE